MLYLFSLFGTFTPPYNGYNNFAGGGLGAFIANIIKLIIVVAGLFTVFNFIFAGFSYLSAGGDSKKVALASAKIWQSIIGLIIVVAAFVIGAIVSNIIFGDPARIFQLNIEGPVGGGFGGVNGGGGVGP